MRRVAVEHRFVDFIPDDLVDGVVYVCIPYATVVHRCCCGCGDEVVTPLSPHRWALTFDGASISLSPSIGNWSFACQSHYWITRNRVEWARGWSADQIAAGRMRDRQAGEESPSRPMPKPKPGSVWHTVKAVFHRRRTKREK